MKSWPVHLVLVAVLASATVAPAEVPEDRNYVTGADAARRFGCAEKEPTDLCRAYVAGIVDVAPFYVSLANAYIVLLEAPLEGERSQSLPNICRPTEVGLDQLVRVFGAYLRDHPESHRISGADLAFEAIAGAFPCEAAGAPVATP